MIVNPASLGGGYGFLVSDMEIMPVSDPLWAATPQELRNVLYELAKREVLLAKRSSLLLGEDVRGGVLLPIHPLTRFARRVDIDYTKPPRGRKPYSPQGRANENNAPLVATGNRARAVTLFRTETVPGGIWGYWDRDPHTGKFWGEILYKHRTGFQQTFYGPSRSGKTKAAAGRYNPSTGWGLTGLARANRRVANIPSRDVIGLPSQWVARIRAKVLTQWRSKIRPQVERITRMDPSHPIPPAMNVRPRQDFARVGLGNLQPRGWERASTGGNIAQRVAAAVLRGLGRLFGR